MPAAGTTFGVPEGFAPPFNEIAKDLVRGPDVYLVIGFRSGNFEIVAPLEPEGLKPLPPADSPAPGVEPVRGPPAATPDSWFAMHRSQIA